MTAFVEEAFGQPDRQVRTAGHDSDHDITVPRGHDSDDDITVPRGHDSGDDMSRVVVALENRIETLENEIAKVGPLVIERG